MTSTLPHAEYGQEKPFPPKVHEHLNYVGQIKWGRPHNVRARMPWSKRSCCRYFGIRSENRKNTKHKSSGACGPH